MEETKKCTKCGEIKPVSEFRLRVRTGCSYFEGACKSCLQKASNEWRRNKLKTDPVYRAKHNAYCAAEQRKIHASKTRQPKEVLPEGMKRCAACKEIKPISEFYLRKDGNYLSYCKVCNNNRRQNYFVCNIIKKHHEEMKGDPNHLSTEFIQTLVGRKCK
jgi:hypothetical protein